MGALTTVLLAPFMFPVWGTRLVLERLREEAEGVMYDENRGFGELIELSMQRNAGKISEAEFVEQEKALLERLSSIRDHREELMNAELDESEYEVENEGENEGEVDAEYEADLAVAK